MATIIGTSANDTITPAGVSLGVSGGIPSAAADSIRGYAGNDTLDGGPGDDTLIGGEGDDVFQLRSSEAQSDTFDGGPGYDRIVLPLATTVSLNTFNPTSVEEWNGQFGTSTVSIFGTTGNDALDFTNIKLVNVPYVDGSGGDDVIKASSLSNDVIRGGSGSDTLYANGDDSLYGDGDADRLYGDANANSLFGGAGDDTLDGGGGGDTLDGGTGNDTLIGGGGDDVFQV